jgi:hypothetical protein
MSNAMAKVHTENHTVALENHRKSIADQSVAAALKAIKVAEQITLGAPSLWHRYMSVEQYPGEWIDMDFLIIHPNSLFVTAWNMIMTMFILFCVLWIPFEMSFNFDSSDTEVRTPFIVFINIVQLAMDIYFLLDMIVQFRTALLVDGELEQKSYGIATTYLTGWFTPDFVSTMGSLLSRMLANYGGLALLRNVKVIRLIRLLKLLRMVRHCVEEIHTICWHCLVIQLFLLLSPFFFNIYFCSPVLLILFEIAPTMNNQPALSTV